MHSTSYGACVNFNDYLEKFNEKTLTWTKKWVVIENKTENKSENNFLFIYDRRPVNESEICKPQEVHNVESCTVKTYREFKHRSLSNKKNYVCVITLSSNVVLIFGLKNEKMMNKFADIITGGDKSDKTHNTENNYFTSNISKTPVKIEGHRDREGLSINNYNIANSNKGSSNKKDSEHSINTINLNPATHSMYNSLRQDFLKFKNKEKIENMCSKIKTRHQKNKSCGDYSDLNKKNKILSGESSHIYQNEENASLSTMINKMLQSSKKNLKISRDYKDNHSNNNYPSTKNNRPKNQPNTTKSYDYEHESEEILDTSGYYGRPPNITSLYSRNKHLNKIIKLSLPNAEKLTATAFLQASPTANKINFEKYSDESKEINSSNKVVNFNLSQDEMSFEDKLENRGNNSNANEIENNVKYYPQKKTDKFKLVAKKLEAFEEYFFDSSIFRKILKSAKMNKYDIGSIYNSTNKDFVKNQLLVEMVAIISKKLLHESILKSLEVVLKEKDMNKNYFIQPTHQHSIEYSIVDIFNTFLGNNHESEEFYLKILPALLSENFKIDFLLNIKDVISIPSLFVTMQNRNKIVFNDNIHINFQDKSPFVVQDIKYISPYYVNKWFSQVIGVPKSGGKVTPVVEGTTNIKRMKYHNFEMKDSYEKIITQFKTFERDSEELRLNLMKNIYFHIFNKRNELGLKLCDYYVQKYADTISLNPIIYLVLSEIYNETLGIELARLFYEKGVNILNWLSPKKDNPLLIDLNYTFSLLLMKQTVNEDDSRGSNSNSGDYYKEIESLLEFSLELCDKFFDYESDKKVKIILQLGLIRLSRIDYHLHFTQSFSLHNLISEVVKSLDYLETKGLFKEEVIYLNLFVDIMRNFNSDVIDKEVKIDFLKRLHETKKRLPGNREK